MESLNLKQVRRSHHARPSSARESKHTPREDSDRKHRKHRDDSRDAASSSDDSSDEEDWTEHVDEAKTVEEGMYRLWRVDPETFYIYGDRIEKMIRYKLERDYKLEDEDDDKK